MERANNEDFSVFFMPPTLEKLRGHIGLGLSVCLSICLSVCPSVHNASLQLGNSRTAYARLFKFHIMACT